MRHFYFSKIYLFLFALFLFAGCNEPTLTVSLSSVPSNTTRIRVRTIVNGTQGIDLYVPSTAPRFVLKLPQTASGAMRIEVSALDDYDCKIGFSALDEQVPGGLNRYAERSLSLAALPAPLCVLSLAIEFGEGSITSEPPGIECKGGNGTLCEGDFLRGTTVSLRAAASASSLIDWWPICSSGPECSAKLDRSQTVSVSFHPLGCSSDGWCLRAPIASGRLLDIAGRNSHDVWAVGEGGLVIHWDGRSWAVVASSTTATLRSVWVAGPRDVWVVGSAGTLLHWDGALFRSTSGGGTKQLNAIWGSTAGDAWAAGQNGSMLHWNGDQWSDVDSPTTVDIYSLWGTATNNVWAVGQAGKIYHFDGKSWSPSKSSGLVNTPLTHVHGLRTGEAWIAGSAGRILHLDGENWVPENSRTTNNLAGLFATSDKQVWAIGQNGTMVRRGSGTWSNVPPVLSLDIEAIWGSADDDIWLVGDDGSLLHWDGTAITIDSSGTKRDLHGLWGSGPNDIWAVGDSGAMIHYLGQRWTSHITGHSNDIAAIWGSASNNIFAVGSAGLRLRWDGSQWIASNGANDLYSVWGASPNKVYASGYLGKIEIYDTMWQSLPPPAPLDLLSISGNSATDIWAVGVNSTVINSTDGMAWSPITIPLPATRLNGVFAAAPGVVWIVGIAGAVLRGGAGSFSLINTGVTANYNAAWTSNPSEIWIVGDNVILHGKNNVWTREQSPTPLALRAIWGSEASRLWAVGSGGVILERRQNP